MKYQQLTAAVLVKLAKNATKGRFIRGITVQYAIRDTFPNFFTYDLWKIGGTPPS